MKRCSFSEEHIGGFLKHVDSDGAVKDLCRKHGFSHATLYNWRSRYGGMEVGDVRRLKEFEGETARLKRLPAEAMLDIESLKVVARGKR